MIAVSGQLPDSTLSMKEKHALEYEVLSDVNFNVARQYGLVYALPKSIAGAFEGKIDFGQYYGNDSKELPITVTYIINTDGIIKYAYADIDYTIRAEPTDIIAELKKLTQKSY